MANSAWVRLRDALNTLTIPSWAMVCPLETKPNKFIVYRAESDNPDLFADDVLIEESTDFTVNLFSKSDIVSDKNTLKTLIQNNEFTVTNTVYYYESLTGYYHVAIECNGGDI